MKQFCRNIKNLTSDLVTSSFDLFVRVTGIESETMTKMKHRNFLNLVEYRLIMNARSRKLCLNFWLAVSGNLCLNADWRCDSECELLTSNIQARTGYEAENTAFQSSGRHVIPYVYLHDWTTSDIPNLKKRLLPFLCRDLISCFRISQFFVRESRANRQTDRHKEQRTDIQEC